MRRTVAREERTDDAEPTARTSASGLRTLVAVLDTGDDAMAGLQDLSARERLAAVQLTFAVTSARAMRTLERPPGTTTALPGAAGSRAQRLPRPLATTLWTQTQWSPGVASSRFALRQEFHSSFG